MTLSRSRSFRGATAPVEPQQKEKEPFFVGPFKPKALAASTISGRRLRANGENVPPENNNTAAYVKANTHTPDGASPAQLKLGSKGRVTGSAPMPGSPALLPRPPSSRPSPAGSNRLKSDSVTSPMQEVLGTVKRKLSLDSGGTETSVITPVSENLGDDSGVKVIVRMRPLNNKEKQEDATQIVHKISSSAVSLGDQQFTYDSIAGEHSLQEEVFDMVGRPMVENCLAGFNSSIFAYGQTGSGKTHTMWGATQDSSLGMPPSEDRGLTPRVFEKLFACILEEEKKSAHKQLRYQCRCSFLEIYNEQITDLLEPSPKNLQIREDSKTGVYVESLTEEYVSNVDDVTRLLLKGLTNRRTGSTAMNNESSRSHSVFTCVIESRFKNLADGLSSVRSSRMNLVDLAGSERQKQTGAAGERLKEAGNINRSLSQLGNVINILAEVAGTGKQRHIPYRDSRLTFLLQESLGGNAKLAMICAVSPASSCRNETLSTLRFAQRAKAIQNKAVVNEETANDVNLLREQIRQLKDELLRMKSNGGVQQTSNGGYSNGWNARRSYNLLRLSLSHPMTITDAEVDNDQEMEIDEDVVEDNSEPGLPEVVHVEDRQESVKEVIIRLPVIEEKECLCGDQSTETDNILDADFDHVCEDPKLTDEEVCKVSDPVEFPSIAPDGCPEDAQALGLESILRSPPLSISPRLRDALEIVPGLLSPALSTSPKVRESRKRSLSFSSLAEHSNSQAVKTDQSPYEEGSSWHEAVIPQNMFPVTKSSALVRSSICGSMPSSTPRDKLAASLHRGLQILDSHQRSSLAASRRSSGVRFSFQNPEMPVNRGVDKAVQTSPPPVMVAKGTSPTSSLDKSPCRVLALLPESTHYMTCNQSFTEVSHQQETSFSSTPLSSAQPSPERLDRKEWQMVALEESMTTVAPILPNAQAPLVQAVEAVLTGAIRRERAAEELVSKLEAEVEQLNRLVRQYKHERECNGILQQSREDKIARLESLMDNVIPTDAFLNEEWSALLLEHKMLEDKFDNHPEVTHSRVEQQRLLDELQQYRMFFDLGEREIMQEEITQLRNQLQAVLENSVTPVSAKHRRFSLTPTPKAIQTIAHSPGEAASECASSSLALYPISHEHAHSPSQDLPLVISESLGGNQHWEEERQQWEERERDWMSVLEEIREEAESYKQKAEKRKHELDCERRCGEEMQEALQMAMTGHARLLEQYAELQEKHIGLIAKQRKIREGVTDIKKLAKRAGVSSLESKWLDAQATQMAGLKVEYEHEMSVAKEEVEDLRSQLRDTADAVQAAGELLVRLKEAEESVSMAQDEAVMAQQSADVFRRQLEKFRRRHATEMATLQQRLLESRLQKTAVCPMCVMAERVKFQFTEADEETMTQARLESEAQARVEALKEEADWIARENDSEHWAVQDGKLPALDEMDEWDGVCTGDGYDDDFDSPSP